MKLDVFKKLIKEAVREVLQEELGSSPTPPVVAEITRYDNYRPAVAKTIRTGDPIMDILNETRASMTQESYRDLVNATSDMVQAPGLGMNPIEGFQTRPAPGLDLSTLSFAKNAGAIYKASVEKDKARFGE
jgi:hypothetical protein